MDSMECSVVVEAVYRGPWRRTPVVVPTTPTSTPAAAGAVANDNAPTSSSSSSSSSSLSLSSSSSLLMLYTGDGRWRRELRVPRGVAFGYTLVLSEPPSLACVHERSRPLLSDAPADDGVVVVAPDDALTSDVAAMHAVVVATPPATTTTTTTTTAPTATAAAAAPAIAAVATITTTAPPSSSSASKKPRGKLTRSAGFGGAAFTAPNEQPGWLTRAPTTPARDVTLFSTLAECPANESARGDIEEFWELDDEIGTGAYSSVLLARELPAAAGEATREPRRAAVKIVDKEALGAKGQRVVEAEVRVLSLVEHESIVRMHALYETDVEYFMVLELIDGGELFDRLLDSSFYSEAKAARIMREALSALAYMHASGFVHRDLKPENLMLLSKDDDSPIKLIDFGLTAHVSEGADVFSEVTGTPQYIAPEMLTCQLHGTTYGRPVDMWAMGVILHILLTGELPFAHSNEGELFKRIVAGDYGRSGDKWKGVSPAAQDLVGRLLEPDTTRRLTADQALNHPWTRGSEASMVNLAAAIEAMKRTRARAKFRGAVSTVLLANKLSNPAAFAAAQRDARRAEEEDDARHRRSVEDARARRLALPAAERRMIKRGSNANIPPRASVDLALVADAEQHVKQMEKEKHDKEEGVKS